MLRAAPAGKDDSELPLNAAAIRIEHRVRVNPDTVRGWCTQAAIDAGDRPGSSGSGQSAGCSPSIPCRLPCPVTTRSRPARLLRRRGVVDARCLVGHDGIPGFCEYDVRIRCRMRLAEWQFVVELPQRGRCRGPIPTSLEPSRLESAPCVTGARNASDRRQHGGAPHIHTVILRGAERFTITQEIGGFTAASGFPPSDPDREAVQISRLRALAEESHLRRGVRGEVPPVHRCRGGPSPRAARVDRCDHGRTACSDVPSHPKAEEEEAV